MSLFKKKKDLEEEKEVEKDVLADQDAEAEDDEKKKDFGKIESVQSWSPINDVQNGLIITKEGKFVQLLEFAPINFNLRAPAEQDAIINEFTGALRNLPSTFQFKITSRRSNVNSFTNIIKEHIKNEPNASCRNMQRAQIRMIKELSSSQSISRRFFVAFPYEDTNAGVKRKKSLDEITIALDRISNNFISDMHVCGNDLLSPLHDNTYTLSALYSIFSRAESEHKDFDVRCNEVKERYMKKAEAKNTEDLIIPVNDFICPTKMDMKLDKNYVKVDDKYYMFAYLPSASYPIRVVAGWMQILINLYDGVDVDVFVKKEDVASTQRKLQYKIRYNNIRFRESEDTNQDYEDLNNAIKAGYYLKQGLSSGDDFCYFSTMLTITADSKEELDWKWNEIRNIFTRNDLKIRPCSFQQEEAFLSSLPICKPNPGLFHKGRRNILTRDLASAYPFVSFEMADKNGILMGFNSSNGSLVFVDMFDRNKYQNGNITILGSSGAGKTYTLLLMALRMRQKGNQIFIIAPYKGEEFYRACKEIGGQFIRISPGSNQNINMMEIRKTDITNNDVLSSVISMNESILSKKIQQLHVFFSLLIPDMSAEERQILDEAMIKTYEKFGIRTNNKSLYDPLNPGKYRKMPILGDLHATLKESGEKASRLYSCISRYVSGSAASFNKQTNVALNNKFIVLDVSTLTEEMLPIGMFMALDYVWDTVKADRTERKIIFMDELWRLIGPGSSGKAAEFVLEIFKLIRSYNGCAVGATQDLNDFFAQEDGRYGKAIINNSKLKILMKTEPREAQTVSDIMELTPAEQEEIKRVQKGTCLLAANTNHVFIDIKASSYEHDLITTSADDLKRISAQKRGVSS